MNIEIKAAFPIEWGREYYTVESKEKKVLAPCTACDNTGKVKIKGEEYTCPRCKGNWREREVVGSTTVYSVGKWKLDSVRVDGPGFNNVPKIVLTFKKTNGGSEWSAGSTLTVRSEFFDTMEVKEYGETRKLYDDYKAALAEVKRLNAEKKEK